MILRRRYSLLVLLFLLLLLLVFFFFFSFFFLHKSLTSTPLPPKLPMTPCPWESLGLGPALDGPTLLRGQTAMTLRETPSAKRSRGPAAGAR
jgi:hypothetical protein